MFPICCCSVLVLLLRAQGNRLSLWIPSCYTGCPRYLGYGHFPFLFFLKVLESILYCGDPQPCFTASHKAIFPAVVLQPCYSCGNVYTGPDFSRVVFGKLFCERGLLLRFPVSSEQAHNRSISGASYFSGCFYLPSLPQHGMCFLSLQVRRAGKPSRKWTGFAVN